MTIKEWLSGLFGGSTPAPASLVPKEISITGLLGFPKEVVLQEVIKQSCSSCAITLLITDYENQNIYCVVMLDGEKKKKVILWEGEDYSLLTENPTMKEIEDKIKLKL